jgi:hypothetical protein
LSEPAPLFEREPTGSRRLFHVEKIRIGIWNFGACRSQRRELPCHLVPAVNVENTKCTLVNGKQSVEVNVKVETVEKKFDTTAVRYTTVGEKQSIKEIRIGGTKTKLIFEEQSGL